jgi:phosphatidylinositol alpha-1,6-mannosyltransferase
MIGRMARDEGYKGHREVIEAWPLVLELLPDARLWIVGEGNLKPELIKLVIDQGLSDRVRFWGWVSEVEKQRLLTRAHCLALPSRGEGFGLVYLEAMRLGRPCLVSISDAGREVVDPPQAGVAVNPQDANSLAEALCRLMDRGPQWDQWSREAKKRYETLFTAEHFQRRLLRALGLD